MVGLVSAAGLVGFLSEPDPELQSFALKQLDSQVDLLWTEIADSVPQIEALYEDESFPERELAAIVASKVYYHLQEYNESMAFALGAGKHFRLDQPGEYEDTIISKCVDTFIALSASRDPTLAAATTAGTQPQLDTAFEQGGDGAASMSASLTSPVTPFSQSVLPSKSLLSRQNTSAFDPTNSGIQVGQAGSPEAVIQQRGLQKALNRVIETLFERCFQEKRYRQVVGIALEARNLDILRRVIKRASEDERKENGEATKKGEELMEYILDICMSLVEERGLRNEILKLILELLNEIPSPDYFAIAKCVVYLDQHSMASNMLRHLVEKGDSRSLAVAYQVSFDLYDNSTQEFLQKVREELSEMLPEETKTEAAPQDADKMDEDVQGKAEDQLQQELQDSAGAPAPFKNSKLTKPEEQDAIKKIRDILDGLTSTHLNIEFLHKSNRVDHTILNKVKDSLEPRYSIYHTAVTLSAGFMHAKTANDTFFRQNLEWLGKAVNWSKFTATAVFGVIHQGNINQVQRLLSPYLPKAGGLGSHDSPYSQGGSLFAYGLLCANHKSRAVDFLREKFKEATEEVVQHGGALGLGVAGMASGDEAVFEDLRNVLWSDSAINGEAVGLAMGLVMLGSGNTKVLSDMIQHAHDTQHEKIVRGLAVGMSLIMYGRQEGADELIQGLLNDTDPTMRYGGILTIAMAYVGTGSNKAVRKLLHVAVSDVSDDVRRIAVLSLGFILFRKYSSVPRMVELLAESYNPHVRYGAAMALGISCAGTGLDEAIDLLEPMLKDPTDFVRQGALIALSMVLIQQTEAMNPKVGTIRKQMLKIISDRHEDAMCKFGCALAMGILDAGGRNCTINLQTQTGNLNMLGIVGIVVFTQYWYWFPLAHFFSLSLTPTSVIGIDQKLEAPVFKFHCNTRPSLFDYPPEQQVKADEAPEKVKTAVLSTTAQAKRRAARKEKQQRRDSMDVDTVTPVTPKIEKGDKMETDEAAAKEDEGKKTEEGEKKEGETGEVNKKKAEKEKVGYEISNMSRVLPAQLKYLSFPDQRYQPVKKPTGGVMVVLDTEPDKEREIIPLTVSKVEPVAAATTSAGTGAAQQAAPQTPAAQTIQSLLTGSGAAAAAGVLTAIDEDEEGAEEAPVPHEFDYETDTEGDGDGEEQHHES
ncbi:proteasome regulatory particle base subunit [Exophiala dermatitidis]|uniref:26S proteasome regulatory subunit RPN2 n=2 Tax=Exophiala dermatitidis TaxID=5970 RepID=H6BMT5_EXODN|nr:26S proteasome regulatory subunit N2 [Exophiala dermatitidis NIH/UT8656]KAJ4514769.1 proteasome regulatory particle base subunit [Exophiala dermatitidis]EHY52113.1 26S proteasome regulatory subunit N2 [Exophiala dermatitidis NIH/UT8656]KAJ4518224.1 proteasome regulatory particle base subunit [Exophiala dermatitidis]KAJ4521122.1 proteasome regulatory particle base subunit [Exophiala dermatitidis]KAJ4547710.1 proteasome regulatory particle base subunit [Exophiala dermatitidis]